jgi:hypothetical protein
MLSVQKCPSDKTALGYVTSPSDIASTKIVFVKPTVPKLPPAYVDKGKGIIGREVIAAAELVKKSHTKRSPPTCDHCGISGHIRPKCPQLQAQKLNVKKELPKKATSGTRSLKVHQAPWHQRQQPRFVFTNKHHGKPRDNQSRHFKKKPQKPNINNLYDELLNVMQHI